MKGELLYRLAVGIRGESSVYQRLAELKSLQREDSSYVLRLQRQLLANTLSLASAHVPYYREHALPSNRITPDNALDALSNFPILEKEALQTHAASLRNETWRGRSTMKTTGGSTGRPVSVLKNSDAVAQELAATWLGLGWFGVHMGDRSIRFWGQPMRNIRRRFRYFAADTAVSRKTLSAFGYTLADLADYVSAIERFRPRYLYGYVSALEDLARFIVKNGMQLRNLDLKSVVTTSEVLSSPQRQLIREAFGVPVQNEYGCGEVGAIAYECSQGTLHLLPTNQFVEVVDDAGQPVATGQRGHLVLTDLTNQAMPLVRYRVGDIGSLGGACTCGCSFPALAEIYGREYDFVDAPDGRRFHGEFFMYVFEDLRQSHPEIGQFQVVQTDSTRLVARIVTDGVASTSATGAAVRAEILRRLPGFEVSVEFVAVLPRRASGKMRVVENQIRGRGSIG